MDSETTFVERHTVTIFVALVVVCAALAFVQLMPQVLPKIQTMLVIGVGQ